MIRILHVVFSLAPGGMENGIVNVSNELDPKEFEVHVCCLDESGAFASRFPDRKNIHCLDRKSGFSLKTVGKLARLIARIKPDLVHSHNFGPLLYSILATGLGRWIPVLHGEHGQFSDEECSPRRLRQRKWLYRCCSEVHTVSHGLRHQIVDLNLSTHTPINALVNGVDLDRFKLDSRPDIRKDLGIGDDHTVIGMVARLRPTKRHTLLIKAFASLPPQKPPVHLVLVGDGPAMGTVKEAVKESGCEERIHLVGFKKDPVPYYHIIDLLVIPSNQEGLSNAVLESLACGVPVICHTACGNDEVITHGKDGWIVPLDTIQQIHEQLASALTQKERLLEMGQFGRAKVANRFPISKMLASYKETYRRIAGRK